MRITNIEFSAREAAALYAMAGATLLMADEPMTREEALAYVKSLTPQNVLRLALGSPFKLRSRGGSRKKKKNKKN